MPPVKKWLLSAQPHETEECLALYIEGDTDYHLSPLPGSTCWVQVGNASVYIKREGEGVIVDIVENARPCTSDPCPQYVPKTQAMAVLEVAAGVTNRHALNDGEIIKFEGVSGYPRETSK